VGRSLAGRPAGAGLLANFIAGSALLVFCSRVRAAATIAKIYKERWQIELFFKCIKQQLKVKSFVGTSQNALLSQLWVALITYLLLSYLKFKSKFNWSLYTLCSILPTNLFSHRNLWDWLNAPFHTKSNKPKHELQLSLSFG